MRALKLGPSTQNLGPSTQKLDRALKILDRALKIGLKLGPSTQIFGPSTQNRTQIGTEHSKVGPKTQNGRDIIVPTLVLKYRSHFHPLPLKIFEAR